MFGHWRRGHCKTCEDEGERRLEESCSTNPSLLGGWCQSCIGGHAASYPVSFPLLQFRSTSQETRLQAIAHHQLKHENIVPFLGVIAFDNTLAIVMPLQEGGNAIDFLKSYNGSDKDVVTLNLVRTGYFAWHRVHESFAAY